LRDSLECGQDFDGFQCWSLRLLGSLLDPVLDRFVFETFYGKSLAPLVCLLRGSFEQQQALGWIKQINPSLTELDGKSIVVELRVIASKTQPKSSLAMQVAMAGPQIATAASERRNHFSVE
jgi:hypothetical protein